MSQARGISTRDVADTSHGRFGAKIWNPGRKGYRWLGTFDTEAAARQAESDAKLKPGAEMPTVKQWARIWLSDYARPAASTQATYRYATQRIARDLGGHRLDAVDRPTARRLPNDWPQTTTKIAGTMWADAVRDGVCHLNPWTKLRLPTAPGRKDLVALTEPEIMKVADLGQRMNGDYGLEVRAIILTLAYTGVRPGELCALRRLDLDERARE